MDIGLNRAVSTSEHKPCVVHKFFALTASVVLASGLTACSGSSDSTAPGVVSTASALVGDPLGSYQQPAALLTLQDDIRRISEVPTVVAGEILADSGLEVAYTSKALSADIPALNIEANWLNMQSCLNLVSVAPLVIVAESVSPLTRQDDVIRTIDGFPFATASDSDIPVLQIDSEDFSTDHIYGSSLRSIMGRLLWSTAGLAVRDYPFECANQVIEP
ncbi:MAG: hypothetical protein AB8B84_01100 [Granulosicoccus sp.]